MTLNVSQIWNDGLNALTNRTIIFHKKEKSHILWSFKEEMTDLKKKKNVSCLLFFLLVTFILKAKSSLE